MFNDVTVKGARNLLIARSSSDSSFARRFLEDRFKDDDLGPDIPLAVVFPSFREFFILRAASRCVTFDKGDLSGSLKADFSISCDDLIP